MALDGSGSKGNAPIACTWTFEDQAGTTVFETLTGCTLQKAFQTTGTKYVKLAIRDSDGDTDTSKQSFAVAAATAPPADTARHALVDAAQRHAHGRHGDARRHPLDG